MHCSLDIHPDMMQWVTTSDERLTMDDHHITTTVPLEPLVHELLSSHFRLVTADNDNYDTLLKLMPTTVGLVSRGLAPIDGNLMDAGSNLHVISRTGAGYENVDIAAATARGIPVVYAPLLAEAVAEGTFALILALTKQLFYWHKMLITGQWDRRLLKRTADLYETTIGIVGLGRIGQQVAIRAKGFGMEILGYDPYVQAHQVEDLGVTLVELDDLLAGSDVVTLHALVTDETTGMINRSNIGKIKRGAYLINFSRGALIDGLEILYDALNTGHLAGVGLDVFPEEPPTNLDHPLFSHPKFIGSPHVLASTVGSEARCIRSWTKDVVAVLAGQRPKWCVNPEVFDAPNLRRPC